MKKPNRYKNFICIIVCLSLSFFFLVQKAQARAVEDVEVKILPDGYEINIRFLSQLQYVTLIPDGPATNFLVQLKTVNFQTLASDEVDSLRERNSVIWDVTTGIPLQEMIFEGGDPERPQMTFVFSEAVELDVMNSVDQRSLIVKVKTKEPPKVTLKEEKPVEEVSPAPAQVPPGEEIKKAEEVSPAPAQAPPGEEIKKAEEVPLPPVVTENKDVGQLMEEAQDALLKGENERAVQLYTKVLTMSEGPVRQQAQEFLGVARERNGQIAHAKAEYEAYLREFPEGPDADRVRQRLVGLITAAQAPKERLKEAKQGEVFGEVAAAKKESKWSAQYFGGFSQFFSRDQTTPAGESTQINRYDLSSDLDLNSRFKSDKMELSARFSGGYDNNFLEDGEDDKSISTISVDARSKEIGLYGRLGRQTLSRGGVLGRFDGIHLSQQISPIAKLNTVFGFPVDHVSATDIQPEKKFYGLNMDWGTFFGKLDLNTFFIEQTNSDIIDRRAMGGEVRYFDQQKAFYTLVDYDTYFSQWNIILFNGHWTLPSHTTFNFVYDFRKSPLLTSNNAIQGQSVEELSDLFNRFSKEEIKQLAIDRVSDSKSLTWGITQDIKQDLQWTGELTISELDGTFTSAGVDGVESTGWDSFYSTQLIASNLLMQDDVFITGLNYSDTAQFNTYTLNLNTRFPITKNTRFIPKLRVDYRDNKDNSDHRIAYRPTGRVDYNFTRWMHMELEVGVEWLNEITGGATQRTTESFASVGYRLNF